MTKIENNKKDYFYDLFKSTQYIPGLNTVVGIAKLFIKSAVIPALKHTKIEIDNKYIRKIEKQNFSKIIALSVPALGAVFAVVLKFSKEQKILNFNSIRKDSLEELNSVLNSKTYQNLSKSKAGNLKITNNLFGNVLYSLGLRTSIDKDVSEVCKKYILELKNKSSVRSLKDIQTLDNVINFFKNSQLNISKKSRSHILLLLKSTREHFLKKLLLSRNMPSFEELTKIVKFDGSPLTKEDLIVVDFLTSKFPELNKSQIAYELLEKKTQNLVFPEKFKAKIKTGKSTVDCYLLPKDHDYQFIVHATSPDNAKDLINLLKNEQKYGSPSFCTSLIDHRTSFFDSNYHVALALTIDPKRIIFTSKSDQSTPVYNPNKADDQLKKMTDDFYNFYEKFKLLSSYIDHIYTTCKLPKDTSRELSDYQKYYRLLGIESDLAEEKKWGNLSEEKEDFLNEVKKQLAELIQKFPNGELKLNQPEFQIHQLINFYTDNPTLANSTKEFERIFHRPGKDILEELQKCLVFFENLKSNNQIKQPDGNIEYLWREQFNHYQSPTEILSQTTVCHNEVNIRIDHEQNKNFNPINTKALIFKKDVLNKFLVNPSPKFEKLLHFAKKRNISILVLQ